MTATDHLMRDAAAQAGREPAMPEAASEELDRILAGDLVRAVYQPIVALETRAVVAYEALARGPEARRSSARTPCSPPRPRATAWRSSTGRAARRRSAARSTAVCARR